MEEEEEFKEFPFVGRVAEVGRCRRLLRKAPAVESGINILVTGERGVGKTRLIQEAMTQARGLGFKTIFHRCQRWDHYRPFTTISGLIRLLLGRPPGWTPRNLDTVAKAISELYPDLHLDEREMELLYWLLGAPAVSEHVTNLDERSRKGIVSTLFGNLLKHQLRRQPFLLLAVDDLHYSDSYSANYLTTSVPGKGFVFLTSAPSSVSLRFRREVEEIAISPFNDKEMKLLLTRRFTRNFPVETFIPELLRVTGGNALYLVQLLESVPRDETAALKLSKMLEDTRVVKTFEIVLARLRRLDPRSLELIEVASVIEDYFPLPILKQMLGGKFPMKATVRHLHRHRLAWVESHKGTHFFQFQHGIVREAAYSLLEGERKQKLHAACAETLKRYYRRRPDKHLMAVAYHYEKAGAPEDAAETYFEAGKYLFQVGDLPGAEEAYRLSERLFDSRDKKLEVMARLIRVLDYESKVEESFAVAQRFFDSDPPPALEANVLCSMARLHGITGSLVKAVEYGEKALRLTEGAAAQKELASACIVLAPVYAYMGRIADALSHGARGYGIAEKLGDKGQMAAALNALAIVNAIDGSLQEARLLFERVSEMWSQMDHFHHAATGKINVAIAMTEMGEYGEAVKRFTEAMDLFEKMGATENSALAKHYSAAALLEIGEYRKGFAMLENAIALFETIGRSPGAGASFLLKASYLLKMGKVEEAISQLDRGWKILAEEGRWRDKAYAVEIRVEAALFSGELEKALEESRKFLEEAERGEVKAIYQGALLTRLRALLEAAIRREAAGVRPEGKPLKSEASSLKSQAFFKEAQEIAALVEEEGFSGQNPRHEALARALLSRLAAERQDFAAAEKLLNEAVTSARLGTEVHAQVHFYLGRALLDAGRASEAESYLAQARETYSDLVREGYRTRELEMVEELLAKRHEA